MFCGISSSLLKFSLVTRGGSDLQWENTSLLRAFVDHKHGRNLSVKLISFIHFLKDCIFQSRSLELFHHTLHSVLHISHCFIHLVYLNPTVILLCNHFHDDLWNKGCQRCKGFVKSLQSCPAICDPMDCSPLGFSVHGIPQARILEWFVMLSSEGALRII